MQYKGREFDANEFGRDLERALNEVVNEALSSDTQALQRACDSVAATHSGQPVPAVLPALKAAIERESMHITIPDENIHAYAEAIAEGRGITVQYEGV